MVDELGWIAQLLDFFFSSRRRHTRCSRDWSSDVCSSDLLEIIRSGEVKRTLARLPGATPETREAIEALSAAIVNKILHAPITKLRESSRAGSPRSWLELVHELFGLGRK